MTLFQWLASAALVTLAATEVLLLVTRQSRRSMSLLRLAVWLTAVVFVVFPDLATRIANVFSIGRGADFLLYGTALSFLVAFFYIIHHLERHREQLTYLVRQIAIQEPVNKPSSADEN